jgi:PqqD family protein of HPr-rel-A system
MVETYPNWVDAESRREGQKARNSPRFFILMNPTTLRGGESPSVSDALPEPRWRIPARQHFVIEEFDDGIVMFDALVGATHLLNVTAAETLTIVQESPGMTGGAIHRRLLERLDLTEDDLPLAALEELLWRLEDLNLVAAFAA